MSNARSICGRFIVGPTLTLFVVFVAVLSAENQSGPVNWGLDRIDQRVGGAANLDNLFRYAADGSGVHLYIIDSGVLTTHQDFGGRATFEANFCPDAVTPSGDDDSHGTHNASIAAGVLAGVAKNASIHSLRAFGPGCEHEASHGAA